MEHFFSSHVFLDLVQSLSVQGLARPGQCLPRLGAAVRITPCRVPLPEDAQGGRAAGRAAVCAALPQAPSCSRGATKRLAKILSSTFKWR